MQLIQVDESLVPILVKATRDGLSMAGVKPVPVGLSKYVASTREVSAIVGLVGPTTGALMVNAGQEVARFFAEKMLGERFDTLGPQVLDCLSEVTNIIAGQCKALLSVTEWKTEKISCPSIVVGTSYFISHYKGMQTTSIDFEVTEMPLTILHGRLFSVSLSLMKI